MRILHSIGTWARRVCSVAGCTSLFLGLLALIVLLTSSNMTLVLLFPTEVPARVESFGPDSRQNWEVRYSYTINGRRFEGEARVSKEEAYALANLSNRGGTFRVRTFAPMAGFGSHIVGHGPPAWATWLALGALALVLLVVAFPLLGLFARDKAP